MKFDKDVLIKHRFWIIAGLALPFALIAIMLLETSVSGQIEAARKQLKDIFALAQKTKDIRTPEETEIKKAEADKLYDSESLAHRSAFLDQEPLFGWARPMEATYHFADGLFAREITLLKMPEKPADWPADKPDRTKTDKGEKADKADKPGELLLHGTLVDADDEKFSLLDRDGKTVHTFHLTPELIKTGLTDAEKKTIKISELRKQNPKEVLIAVGYQKARYFNDRLTGNEQLNFAKSYTTQIPAILRQVDPLRIEKDENGKPFLAGVVQLRASNNWMFDASKDRDDYVQIPHEIKDRLLPPDDSKFLRFVAKEWDTKNDISDEAWIAQEDLWIQKELFRLVRVANDSISKFTVVSKDPKTKSAVFKNPYFQMTLQLKDPKLMEVRISNLLNRRQKVEAMKIRVLFTEGPKAEAETMPLVTESKFADPLEPRGDPNGKDSRVIPVALEAGRQRTGIYGLEQVLTWETAAVKRVDHIAIGSTAVSDISVSQKNMAIGIRPFKEEKKEEASTDKSSGGPMTSGSQGGPQGAQMGKGFGGGPGGPGNRQGAAAATALANGLSPERYMEVKEQFRRIPVAIVLIVDQNQVDRVQTAFNNSKLRFLMTQVLLNHYPKSLKPELPTDKSDDAGSSPGPGSGAPPAPGGGKQPGPGGGMPPGIGSGGGPGIPGGGRPFGPGGSRPFGPGPQGGYSAAAAAAPADEMETNMEVVLYGIVTLYERYPLRPSTATAEAPKN